MAEPPRLTRRQLPQQRLAIEGPAIPKSPYVLMPAHDLPHRHPEVVGVYGGNATGQRIHVPADSLVGAPERIDRLAGFIVPHWEKRRAAMEGNAMVVTMSRDIAARLYEAFASSVRNGRTASGLGANLMSQLIARRYERGSIILTSGSDLPTLGVGRGNPWGWICLPSGSVAVTLGVGFAYLQGRSR